MLRLLFPPKVVESLVYNIATSHADELQGQHPPPPTAWKWQLMALVPLLSPRPGPPTLGLLPPMAVLQGHKGVGVDGPLLLTPLSVFLQAAGKGRAPSMNCAIIPPLQ